MGRIAVSGGTPSIAEGEGFTITDGGAGRVTINITKPGKQLINAIATVIDSTTATAHSAKALSVSVSAVEFGIFVHDATDGALVDNVGFSFEITLSDVSV